MGYPGRSLDRAWWSCLSVENKLFTGVMILLVWGRDKPAPGVHRVVVLGIGEDGLEL